jgi:tRNA pseudouridine55 synthase
MNGWICLDKPAGISSNCALMKVRKILGGKVGYIGTLDPFATGVLPIAVGEARKYIPYVIETEKTYVFTVAFGVGTDTLDICGTTTETTNKMPSAAELADIIIDFVGEISQVPPVFSAIKIDGKRACDRVRRGESVQMTPRKVTIFSLELLDYEQAQKTSCGAIFCNATFRTVCSGGTYIRSLARDIASKSGSVAHVAELRRTKSGFFCIEDAITLEKLIKMEDTGTIPQLLVPCEGALGGIQELHLGLGSVLRLQRGVSLLLSPNEVSGVTLSSNALIFDESTREFRGVGFVSAEAEVRAVRMCAY